MWQRVASASLLAVCSACGQAELKASAEVQSVDDARALAFRNDCADSLSNLNETIESLEAAGWAKVDPASHAELKAIYDISAVAVTNIEGTSIDAYSRNVGEYRLHMLISGNVPTELGFANGCYVYDFDADSFVADPDSGRVIESWLGGPPTEAISQAGFASQKTWVGPAAYPKFASVRVVSVPAGSPVETSGFFSGAAWAATAFAD